LDSKSLPAEPGRALSALAPALAATFASLAGDIALVIDAGGVVRSVAGGDSALGGSVDLWQGRSFVDTASAGTRRKLEQMLCEVSLGGHGRRREVNHPSDTGLDIPVAWSALRLGDTGPVLAFGRDLRATAAIQQRFVETQQELERDYWKRRQAETRYRLLSQVATDAVLVLDAQSGRVIEANRAAEQVCGQPISRLVGSAASDHVDTRSRPALAQLLAGARSHAHAAEIALRLACDGRAIDVCATPFRSDHTQRLLLRARPAPTAADTADSNTHAVVVCDPAGRVLAANDAFLKLCAHPDVTVEGERLDSLLPDPDGRLAAAIEAARRQGIAAGSVLELPAGSRSPARLDVAAALLPEGEQERIGLTLRRLDSPSAAGPVAALTAAVEGLAAELGGPRSLPQLMRDAAALFERHLIDTAMASHGPDLDTVAAVLGIARGSLELRLHRLDR
jgi:transcriptional regulator PpsR